MSSETRPTGSIRSRLTAAFVLTALISVVLVGILLVGLLRLAADSLVSADLRRQSDVIAGEPTFFARDPRRGLRVLGQALDLSSAVLYRIQPSGDWLLVAGTEQIPASELERDLVASGVIAEGRFRTAEGERILYVARAVGGRGRNAIVLTRSSGLPSLLLGPLVGRLGVAALIAVGVGAGLALFFARKLSDPLRELAVAAGAVAKGDFERRVPVASDDEVGVVARAFNEMAEDLSEADRRQREFFLSISHELRTPLTAIQGYAEGIEDGTVSKRGQKEAAAVIGAESRRLSRLVSDLLDLARVDAGRFQISTEDVEVGQALSAVEQAFRPKAEEAGVLIGLDSGGGRVKADYDRLVQILSNLVENALRYTPAGKQILLSSSVIDGWCEIKVTDGGVGFEAEDLPRAFERQFLWGKYRGVRDVGTGLGLAITKELTEAMDGSVRAGNAPDGGAEFTVRLRSA